MLRPPIDPNTNPLRHIVAHAVAAHVDMASRGHRDHRRGLVSPAFDDGVARARVSIIGVMFVEWPEHTIWNTRFLPFWMLSWALLAAMGATEIARFVAMLVVKAYRWIRDGDLRDARARAWAEIATAEVDPDADAFDAADAACAQGSGVGVGRSEVRSRTARVGSHRPSSRPRPSAKVGRRYGAIAIAVVVGVRRDLRAEPRLRRGRQQPRDRDPRLGRVELRRLRAEGGRIRSTTRS